ncbi:MAG: hypothetical protein U5K69_14610 [Balneolaceae bacterium]|nr:hypothetical protein [Balneolaceae bacterium]
MEPSDPDEPFTSGEFIYHRVKRMKEVFKQVRLLYAKYLGMAKLLTFYWDDGQLLPYEEARSNDPIVSWEGIKNISIKQLLGMAHSAKYAAYIRFMFYREEKQFSVKQAYDTVLQEVKELNVSFDYTLPYEPLNLNKAAKYHIKNLRSEAGKENKG